ncbi:tumor susceptibility protein [Cordyceps fumosorosea ARSEF 2679]|uniref:Tumor susceptibility protein n=1 Tax=Cordyceps fumosorosea (strain ARSEF 2679) TaxID=1081104 RepID=A0A162MPS9_CORFA|nr:tumor susceptibility protein [Cordyceps fumosorosea ARSEF 2679]OAA65020.1 tumor susceptibility protein [Cordyceps fumosorosea ARSEF 2679]
MTVQQHVLNWLYSVLTSEYHDVNRSYDGIARVLSRYPTLSPRTDVYTSPDGASALLVHLSGTLPVNFRGSTYRFPLSIWIPHRYPREPPIIYVTPTESMLIRPGQHVDQQGQVYHPYLVGWQQFWDKSTLQDFLAILADVFAKEPPVVARQPRPAAQPQPQPETPPPVPPLPVEMAARPVQSPASEQARPPIPPKSPQDSRSTSGPPLPPLPPTSPLAQQRQPSRYDSAPPLPPQAHQHELGTTQGVASFGATVASPPVYPPHQSQHQANPSTGSALPTYSQGNWQQQPPQPGSWGQMHHNQTRNYPPEQSTAHAQPPPPQDLLLDDPLTIDIPPPSTVKAPPIPPNPEKDQLLRQLAQTLAYMRKQSRQQNEQSMTGLQAQRAAMVQAMAGLQSELGQLTQLSSLLASNTNILHEALRRADGVIEGSAGHAKPDIDELLVAPTVVSNQLYSLVAEERALGDAIFMLGRAVERGKIPAAVFAKTTRSLAREWYLKKALARKIAEGMGMGGVGQAAGRGQS